MSQNKVKHPNNTITCDACSGVWPDPENQIVELTQTKVYLHDDQYFAGWTVLVLKHHATELFQLAEPDRNQLMQEVSTVAAALTEVFSAVKMNYALLGNLLPHIHWHLIPRMANDPAPRDPPFNIAHAPIHLIPSKKTERLTIIRTAIQKI